MIGIWWKCPLCAPNKCLIEIDFHIYYCDHLFFSIKSNRFTLMNVKSTKAQKHKKWKKNSNLYFSDRAWSFWYLVRIIDAFIVRRCFCHFRDVLFRQVECFDPVSIENNEFLYMCGTLDLQLISSREQDNFVPL